MSSWLAAYLVEAGFYEWIVNGSASVLEKHPRSFYSAVRDARASFEPFGSMPVMAGNPMGHGPLYVATWV